MRDKTKKTIEKNYGDNLEQMKSKLGDYLEIAEVIPILFGGPSIYFHHKALLEANKKFLGTHHLDMIYAVLPSWGMHRMGKTMAKVCSFSNFENSICKGGNRAMIDKLRKISKDELLQESDISDDISDIAELIPEIEATISDAHIVSASKTLHHILPHIVPPIDREYSLRFMKQGYKSFNKSQINVNKKEDEKDFVKIFMTGMKKFFTSKEWKPFNNKIERIEPNPQVDWNGAFNTSLPKIFDNLIVAFVKCHRDGFTVKEAKKLKAKVLKKENEA